MSTDSGLDNQLFNIWTELKRLNAKIDSLTLDKPVPNIPAISPPPMRIRPIVRTSGGLLQQMELRSVNAAMMVKEAPKPEEVK